MPTQFTSKQQFPKRYTIPVGTKFGKLTVTGSPVNVNRSRRYPVECECGTHRIISASELNKTKSCSICRKPALKHGASADKDQVRLYDVWSSFKARCQNQNNDAYRYYGGRGITFCDEWREFIPFRDWALANGYADNLTIDRKDYNGNYEPENCRWVTQSEQVRNTSHNVWITAFGETKLQNDWFNDPRHTVSQPTYARRIRKGWTPYDAMFTPRQATKGRTSALDANSVPISATPSYRRRNKWSNVGNAANSCRKS